MEGVTKYIQEFANEARIEFFNRKRRELQIQNRGKIPKIVESKERELAHNELMQKCDSLKYYCNLIDTVVDRVGSRHLLPTEARKVLVEELNKRWEGNLFGGVLPTQIDTLIQQITDGAEKEFGKKFLNKKSDEIKKMVNENVKETVTPAKSPIRGDSFESAKKIRVSRSVDAIRKRHSAAGGSESRNITAIISTNETISNVEKEDCTKDNSNQKATTSNDNSTRRGEENEMKIAKSIKSIMETDNSIILAIESKTKPDSSIEREKEQENMGTSEKVDDSVILTETEQEAVGIILRKEEDEIMSAPNPHETSPILIPKPGIGKMNEMTPHEETFDNQTAENSIYRTVMQKLEEENVCSNLIDTLTDRVFCGGGKPEQLHIAVRDEIAGRWGVSMWDKKIPAALQRKIESIVGDMEIKYHQLASDERRHRVSEVMSLTQRSSQMEPLFGTIEVSDGSESEYEKSSDDSFEDTRTKDDNTPVSFSRGIPRPILDCMKSPEVTPATTEESPEEKKTYIPKGVARVMDDEMSEKFPPRVVATMHNILPMTPTPKEDPKAKVTSMPTKTEPTPATPATVVRKKGGRPAKQHKEQLLSRKRLQQERK